MGWATIHVTSPAVTSGAVTLFFTLLGVCLAGYSSMCVVFYHHRHATQLLFLFLRTFSSIYIPNSYGFLSFNFDFSFFLLMLLLLLVLGNLNKESCND